MTTQEPPIPWPKRALGATGLMVPPLCIGTSELSNWVNFYPNPPSEVESLATVRAILDGPFAFLDTASGYGESERRIGVVLQERGGLPNGFVLATKVDADAHTRDFGAAQVRRCIERSLKLLGIERLQLVYLHDPEYSITFEQAMASDGPVAALQQCRDEGLLDHIGIAGGPIELMLRYVETGAFEVVLSHNRFTLLNVAAERLWDATTRRGLAAVNAAPYGGSILSKGPAASPTYAYKPASPELLQRARRLEELCAAYEVPLGAAALQFSLREPRITSTILGISRPERLAQTIALAQHPIPDALWSALQTVQPDSEDLGGR
jgi:D-threo-aldose 1-dehydrogenase